MLSRFVLDLFSERKAVTAWDPVDGESHLDTLLRAIVISRLGRAGDQVTLFSLIFDRVWDSIIYKSFQTGNQSRGQAKV